MNVFKRLLYNIVRQDTRNIGDIANKLGDDYMEEESKKNLKDPSRALRKAAISAATWYAGGLLGGAAGAGAGGAAGAAGSAIPAAAGAVGAGAGEIAGMTAQEAAQIAAQQAAEQAAQQAALQAAQQAPQGFANTMEAGLLDTGYTPSTAFNAMRYGGGSGQGVMNSLGKWGGAQAGKFMSRPMGSMADAGKAYMKGSSLGLLGGGEPQQQPAMMPRAGRPQPYQPQPSGYGQQGGYGGGQQGYGGGQGMSGLPPELQGLPPDDPRVIEWLKMMQSRGGLS